jgi:hypothetical protein
MENNAKRENWITGVMNSTSGMQRATPRADLYGRVMEQISLRETTAVHLPAKRWIAAVILLLLLNIGSIVYVLEQEKKTTNTAISGNIFTEIQSPSTYNY